jgi:2-phosphosulfolactate phosphatase
MGANRIWYHRKMPTYEIAFTTESADERRIKGKVCVVIDVLRASTTIVVALANGCPEIIPVETPQEARNVAARRGYLMGGERNGLRIDGFDFGNSPLEYIREKINNRPIVFTTTNGTRAVRGCASSRMLVLASFLNAGTIIRLLEHLDSDTLIVCAGTRGKSSIEDTVCGGMLLDGLRATGTPQVAEAISLWKRYKDNLAGMMKNVSRHGATLVELGFEKDIDFAAAADTSDIVPVFQSGSIVRDMP